MRKMRLLAGCIAAVNKLLCDTPPVDLSRDRTALCGKFPEDELKAGRELEFRNMLNLDEFTLVEKLLPPMTWFGLMSGGATELGQESVCVSSRPRSLEMICLQERQTLFYQVFVGQSCELQ